MWLDCSMPHTANATLVPMVVRLFFAAHRQCHRTHVMHTHLVVRGRESYNINQKGASSEFEMCFAPSKIWCKAQNTSRIQL